jgi:hypothetical protein
MLINSLEKSQQDSIRRLIPMVEPYAERVKKTKNSPVTWNEARYDELESISSNKSMILNCYYALSVATLRNLSNKYHSDHDPSFDRCISSHEYLIREKLLHEHGLQSMRQLLIGNTHADIYVPALHLCIEPSSEKYFSRSRRSKAEDESDRERMREFNLPTWRTENYGRTAQQLRSMVLHFTGKNQSGSIEQIQNNLYSMAWYTLNRFMPYESLKNITKKNQ